MLHKFMAGISPNPVISGMGQLAGCRLLAYGLLFSLVANLGGCGGQPEKPQTLGDIDLLPSARDKSATARVQPVPATRDQPRYDRSRTKQAYYDYVRSAPQDDIHRAQAIRRIAELELSADTEETAVDSDGFISDEQFEATVRDTIRLLNDALTQFPDAPGNDQTMYQLAKAHDQIGEGDQAVAILERLVARYPGTPHYVEARFRIAEHAFSLGHYFPAEDGYTDVLKSEDNAMFREKALFKRGWARFKQRLYMEALEDYFGALDAHDFGGRETLARTERELYDEYFRGIALTFINLGGADALNDYFQANPNAAYAYRSYAVVSDLLLEQQRFSDAAETLEAYTQHNADAEGVVHAALKTVYIWKNAGFFERYEAAFDNVYQQYHPGADYWQTTAMPASEKKPVMRAIRENVVQLASHYHTQYQKDAGAQQLRAARVWYERYLDGFDVYARQDKIYPLYASLLQKAGDPEGAFPYFERAAFDGELVLDKESAYACVQISDMLYKQVDNAEEKGAWLQKHLTYAGLYADLYPAESQTVEIVQNAVQEAFKNRLLVEAIALAGSLPAGSPAPTRRAVNLLKAQAMFDLDRYADAETMYRDLLADSSLSDADRQRITNQWALSIYRQGEVARRDNRIEIATAEWLRVYREVPESELAPTALYDAIALFMQHEQWDQAILYLNRFQQVYPQHPLQRDVGKKLSVAYLQSDRSIEAAREFEKLAESVESEEEKMAALWKAAELYAGKDDQLSALRAWQKYIDQYPRPYAQNLEAMNHVAQLYREVKNHSQWMSWLRQILQQDTLASASVKNNRTRFIAASAAFELAGVRLEDFNHARLVHPLQQSLRIKKTAMQETVKLYGQASQYGHQEFITRATFEIGDMYRRFAVALLESERPRELTADELDQYNILLEDQAFPFEDKAIEFYEMNVERIAEGLFDDWVQRSLQQLGELFPARYARQGKTESTIRRL